jgi:predicted GNAT family acetyltransferase
VVLDDDQPVGLGLIARQGWTSRLAAMGIVPEMTGQGIGKWFLAQLLDQARRRKDRHFVLEVIEQNTPGVRLYKGAGFNVVQRLCGYSTQSTPLESGINLKEIDVFDVAKQLVNYGPSDLPWQAAGTTIARMGPPNRAYQLGPASAVISDPTQEAIMLRTVVVSPNFQRQGHGTKMARALISHFSDKTWKIPAICPQSIGTGFFETAGFVQEELSQFQMEMKLDGVLSTRQH